MIVVIALITILLFNIVGLVITKLLFSNEFDNLEHYGKLVEVNGKKMHVYSMGEGEITIVLLPGMSVPLPSADFGPLMRMLSKQFKVVCIEYFGVGFSDQTLVPRLNENYTIEIRNALLLAGFNPPYVLMPHSASGIYCEYYASKYPHEISSIIMLDTTSSAVKEANIPRFIYQLSMIHQVTGFNRIINHFIVPILLQERHGYTKKEIHDYKIFMNNILNKTIIDQNIRFKDNVKEVMTLNFPKDVSVLKIVSSGTLKQLGEKYQIEHVNRLGCNSAYSIIDGSHFLYQTQAKKICEITHNFLKNSKTLE